MEYLPARRGTYRQPSSKEQCFMLRNLRGEERALNRWKKTTSWPSTGWAGYNRHLPFDPFRHRHSGKQASPRKSLLDYRQAKFTQRLLARRKGPHGPEKPLEERGSKLTERLLHRPEDKQEELSGVCSDISLGMSKWKTREMPREQPRTGTTKGKPSGQTDCG